MTRRTVNDAGLMAARAWAEAKAAELAAEAALEAARNAGPCALCGALTRQWSDLCDDCNDAFQDLADALEDAAQPAPANTVHVAGQLELVPVQACLCGHAGADHDQDLQDGPDEALAGEAPIVCRYCVCELFEAEA